MILKKLAIENKSDLEFVEKLYIESFPPNERRSIGKMHDLIEKQDKFTVYILLSKDEIKFGFYTVWTFNSFSYLEHFAICPKHRNGGLGKRAVSLIIEHTKLLPLIGEIELPNTSELASRRLNFYKRQGFEIWNNIPYYQPPYEKGFECLPMILISYGDVNMVNDSESIVNKIYDEVYQWKKN